MNSLKSHKELTFKERSSAMFALEDSHSDIYNLKFILRRILMVFLMVLIVVSIEVGVKIHLFAQEASSAKADAILVLGCGIEGSQPSIFMKDRLDKAIGVYSQGYAPLLIVSGGFEPPGITEAAVMRTYLLNHGIPSRKILIEDKSLSTKENLQFSQVLMKEHNIKNVLIISNDFQLRRASIFARRLGVEASFAGVYDHNQKMAEAFYYMRDIAASIYYRML